MSANEPIDDASGTPEQVVDLEERSWLPRHCRGDREAFGELLAAYRAPVYGYLARCGLPAAARDDLFQDIFLKVHAAAASYQPARPLRPWLFTIAANTVRNHFRRERPGRGAGDTVEPMELPDPRACTEGLSATQETVEWLEKAIAALPHRLREVVLLSAVEGFSHQEVAGMLGIPVGTVKARLHRARLALASALALAGETP